MSLMRGRSSQGRSSQKTLAPRRFTVPPALFNSRIYLLIIGIRENYLLLFVSNIPAPFATVVPVHTCVTQQWKCGPVPRVT